MNYKEKYKLWLESESLTEEEKNQLKNLDEKEIKELFYKDLEFGTAGIRGILGLGTNRLNRFTFMKAILALADLICETNNQNRGVVIGRDVRHMSKEFSIIARDVLISRGIKVYYFEDIQSTPMISFAIRELKTISGIMITASHNPKIYNGLKVYWQDGSQILDNIAEKIINHTKKYDTLEKITYDKNNLNKDLLNILDENFTEKYYSIIREYNLNEKIDKDIKIVYTPLNGVGGKSITNLLKDKGFNNLILVDEQMNPDPDFTTVGYPNPEFEEAFELAKEYGYKENADILIGTDPDADRIGVMVLVDEKYRLMTGNEIGSLLTYYILSNRKDLKAKDVIVKSIVTGDMPKAIAKKYGVDVIETLTGFKNIMEIANKFDRNKKGRFIYGFEESIGYLYKDIIRDKDAISTAVIIVEMAAFYKKQNKNLYDALKEIRDEFGYYLEDLFSLRLEGVDGKKKIDKLIEKFRKENIKEIGDSKLIKTIDYLKEKPELKSNVLKFIYSDGSWFAVRPSGTEPLIKFYLYSNCESYEKSDKMLLEMKDLLVDFINEED